MVNYCSALPMMETMNKFVIENGQNLNLSSPPPTLHNLSNQLQ